MFQIKNIENLSYEVWKEELKKHQNIIPNPNQLYICLNKTDTDILIIDTDCEKSYKVVKNYLKENDLYDKSTITKSFRNVKQGITYKNHFWFRFNKDQFKDYEKSRIGVKGDFDIDLFISGGIIGEFPNAEIDYENLLTIDLENVKQICELTGLKLKKCGEKKIIKTQVKKTKKSVG
jgi:hypothetical protein